jgi:hypothetical protein
MVGGGKSLPVPIIVTSLEEVMGPPEHRIVIRQKDFKRARSVTTF